MLPLALVCEDITDGGYNQYVKTAKRAAVGGKTDSDAVILAIAASNAADFTGISCSVPSKLGYNVAAVSRAISMDHLDTPSEPPCSGSLILHRTPGPPPFDGSKSRSQSHPMVHLGPTRP